MADEYGHSSTVVTATSKACSGLWGCLWSIWGERHLNKELSKSGHTTTGRETKYNDSTQDWRLTAWRKSGTVSHRWNSVKHVKVTSCHRGSAWKDLQTWRLIVNHGEPFHYQWFSQGICEIRLQFTKYSVLCGTYSSSPLSELSTVSVTHVNHSPERDHPLSDTCGQKVNSSLRLVTVPCHSPHFISSWRHFITSHHQKKGEYNTVRYFEGETTFILLITVYCYNSSILLLGVVNLSLKFLY